MRAEFVEQADAAMGIAESDQIFAQQLDADRRAIRRGHLRREQRGELKAAEVLARGSAGGGLSEQVVFGLGEHYEVLAIIRVFAAALPHPVDRV